MAAHFIEEQALRLNPEVVAFHDEYVRVDERTFAAAQNGQFESMRIQFDEIGAWEVAALDFMIDRSAIHFRPICGLGCRVAGDSTQRVVRIEPDLTWLFGGCGDDVIDMRVRGAESG